MTTLTTWFRSELWFWSHDSLYFLSMRLCSQAGFKAEQIDSLHKKLNWEFCSKSASVLMGSLVSEPKNPSGMQQKASDPCRGLTTTQEVSKSIYTDRCCGSLPACPLLTYFSSFFHLCCYFPSALTLFQDPFSAVIWAILFCSLSLISSNLLVFRRTFYNV